MEKIEIYNDLGEVSVVDFITKKLTNLYFKDIMDCLKKKDIRVNDIKINKNQKIAFGDKITIFLDNKKPQKKYYEIIYTDENIVVVNKDKNIEVCDGENTLLSQLKGEFDELYAVHRIDRNTKGLVVFARNIETKNLFKTAFSGHLVEKYYLAEVVGILKEKHKILTHYLVKDEENSKVTIYANKKENAVKIVTEYTVLKENQNSSLLEVKIEQGKTHQIRAHLSYIGHPIIGDDKYGDYDANKKFKKQTQELTAYKIVFNFPVGHKLEYLNSKNFALKLPF